MIAQAQKTIIDLYDPIQQGTAPSAPVEGMLWLDTSQTPAAMKRWTGTEWETVNEVEIGGVNLIAGSASHTVIADSSSTFWVAADELESGGKYTFSVDEVRRDAGTATGATWALVNQNNGTLSQSGTLAFSTERQIVRFQVPETAGNWSLYLYAGLQGSTSGNTVTYVRAMLQSGSVATSWSAAPEDFTQQLDQLLSSVAGQDSSLETRIRALIDAMGLSEQFASTGDLLELLQNVELIRSEQAQTDSDLTLTFSRLTAAETGLTQMFSYFEFGDDAGTPYLDMGASSSSIRMRLTNTQLSFVQAGKEQAYFSNNKLYVTQLEAVEQISIGTEANGFLDIITTPTGVGQKWRS